MVMYRVVAKVGKVSIVRSKQSTHPKAQRHNSKHNRLGRQIKLRAQRIRKVSVKEAQRERATHGSRQEIKHWGVFR